MSEIEEKRKLLEGFRENLKKGKKIYVNQELVALALKGLDAPEIQQLRAELAVAVEALEKIDATDCSDRAKRYCCYFGQIANKALSQIKRRPKIIIEAKGFYSPADEHGGATYCFDNIHLNSDYKQNATIAIWPNEEGE